MVLQAPSWAGNNADLAKGPDGKTNVCIVGGGNAAHVLVGYLGSRPDELNVRLLDDFSDEAARLKAGMESHGGLKVVNDLGGDVVAVDALISNDPEQVIPGAHVIILSLPSFAAEHYLSEIAPFIDDGAVIGSLPAQGGFDIVARKCLGEHADRVTIFGLETLPWACRLAEYGSKVEVLGTKKQVDFVASPAHDATRARDMIQELIGPEPRLDLVDNFLAVTLMNINSVWHPCISYGAYKDWDGRPFAAPPPFYEGVDDFAASVLTNVSDEVIALKEFLCKKYPGLDLSATKHVFDWIKDAYQEDIADNSSLRAAINTNKGYKGLVHPCVEAEGGEGFMPNFRYRYFSEDIPVGLMVTRGVAELAGVPTPHMDEVIVACQIWMGKEYIKDGKVGGANVAETRAPQNFGHTTIEGFMDSCRYNPALDNEDGGLN